MRNRRPSWFNLKLLAQKSMLTPRSPLHPLTSGTHGDLVKVLNIGEVFEYWLSRLLDTGR